MTRDRILRGTFHHVAPLGTADIGKNKAHGRAEKKPWEYDVTVAIPHLDTLEPLLAAVALLRLQTIKPYILIIDTGSPPEVTTALEMLRDVDLEIHYIAAHGYRHSSEPVTVALDVAQTLCRTDHLFHTHADVFLRRRDLLEHWVRICTQNTPAVGYRMSPRDWATTDWEWMIGHSALMLYMPSIHRIGATWSFQRVHAIGYDYASHPKGGWPDTEIAFNHALRDAGIEPIFLGHDVNATQSDANFVHVRSYTGSRVYGQGSAQAESRGSDMALEIQRARARALHWERSS